MVKFIGKQLVINPVLIYICSHLVRMCHVYNRKLDFSLSYYINLRPTTVKEVKAFVAKDSLDLKRFNEMSTMLRKVYKVIGLVYLSGFLAFSDVQNIDPYVITEVVDSSGEQCFASFSTRSNVHLYFAYLFNRKAIEAEIITTYEIKPDGG